ncbi:glycosyl hydrolases family 38 N-terminal domain-containing protein [Endogone sp. FLAS-F59071]|nr:glycosyl hydrolases family 38 N-terminal domain-containing protein [Endogone sp. FLAS-F59071]|eukprot:RUS22422.1 glycosyl hydrolases family 38 N-terminal domain-containing protein [Endogone sp. FLAS-F59071]
MACNGLFGTGEPYDICPPNPNKYFTLKKAELVVPNKPAWKVFYDLQVIYQVSRDLPQDSVRAAQALYAANKIVNTIKVEDETSLHDAAEIAKEFFGNKNGTSQHSLTAVGHCHIDTAWLWPYAETRRKIARSWSSQLRLMEQHPEYVFVCSQAQQYEWLEQDYPSLFEEVKEKVKEGRFQPIGGTWVEMDCNIPSGESFCRQFLLGQRFFREKFGYHSNVFWLPDTFGGLSRLSLSLLYYIILFLYLPQIIRESNMKYFFTQKLSWNNINKFPLTTFHWIGLDGSKVLSHMAPSNTYNARCMVSELIDSAKNHKDKMYSNESLIVHGRLEGSSDCSVAIRGVGIGDGGGGPVPQYLERLDRMKDIVSGPYSGRGEGLPKVAYGSAESFYDRLERDSRDLASWKGELYFEFHRGTYTTAAAVKRYNRKNELLLRDLEQIAAVAGVVVDAGGYRYIW